MSGPGGSGGIEVVRGRLNDDLATQIAEFRSQTGALDEAAARERLDEVVCLLRDDGGAIVGVNAVYPAPVELLGGRTFWIYRSLLVHDTAEAQGWLLNAALTVLEAEFDPDGPIGVCVLLDEHAVRAYPRQAKWLYPSMLYAGYVPDGRQLRVRYFSGARLAPAGPFPDFAARVAATRPFGGFQSRVEDRYRIDVFDEQSAVSADAVIDLWLREGMMTPDEANRRISEVVTVATDGGRELVGVSTAYIQHNAQLRMDLWYYRTFVTAEHRFSYLAWGMTMMTRDHLQQRFVGRQDNRAGGVLFELENEGLKRRWPEAVWLPIDFSFIGENERGDHVRVHYFPGALAPLPL